MNFILKRIESYKIYEIIYLILKKFEDKFIKIIKIIWILIKELIVFSNEI